MAAFTRGLEVEDRIKTKLDKYGCTLQSSEKLDHKHKLDFVLTQFPDAQKFFSIGVQVTSRINNPDKLREFYQANSEGHAITTKAVFVELADGLDLEDGGALAVFNALTSIAFDRNYSSQMMLGVHIYKDLMYEFFDVKERIVELEKQLQAAHQAAKPVPAPVSASTAAAKLNSKFNGGPGPVKMSGFIHSYSRVKAFGYITGQDGGTYFFHRSEVRDDSLLDKLNREPYSEKQTKTEINVRFLNLGRVRADGQYDSAGEVELDYSA